MYSLLPALVSALFLGYGAYVVAEKGLNRITLSFLLLCLTTFVWQASWAVLFQVHDTAYVDSLIRFGYLFILFVPTTLYHFSIEISGATRERRWAYVSYAIATVLAGFDIFSHWLIDGHYHYFFGDYPKAGLLHPVHVLQTIALGLRSFYVIWQKRLLVSTHQKARYFLRLISVLVYFIAAMDYLGCYGIELYPLSAIFIPISLGLMSMALTHDEVKASVAVACVMAHEIRTPLLSIRMLADGLAKHLPELHKGYQLAIEHGLIKANIRPLAVQLLADLSHNISHHIHASNTIIDMMLAHARTEPIDTCDFALHSMRTCVNETLDDYPFELNDRQKVTLVVESDFTFYGSALLMRLVLFNLLKNSLYALKVARQGHITVTLGTPQGRPTLTFTDTGCGIAAHVLPHIFDVFFTTKSATGHGLGLPFCRYALAESNAQIDCFSKEGEYTSFVLIFPPSTEQLKIDDLPLVPIDQVPVQTQMHAPPSPPTATEPTASSAHTIPKAMPLTGKIIILAEDEASNRAMMLGYLESLGLKVLEAENGQQVLDHLEHGAPADLILMDMQMPVLNGLQTTIAIRSKNWAHQHVPILALSGNSDPTSILATTQAGMNDFVVKTGDLKALREKIQTWLSSAGQS